MRRALSWTILSASFPDGPFPPLQVPVPDRAIEIDDALLDCLELFEVPRAVVDAREAALRDATHERHEEGHRIEKAIDRGSDRVAEAGRGEERQDEIWPRPDAVDAQR